MDNVENIRLQIYISRCGYGSRRKCEEIILSNRIAVNGQIINTLGYKVNKHDIITVDGKRIIQQAKKYIALNKPKGYLCSNKDNRQNKPLAIELISESIKERLFHVGRLDFLSSGLIFYTNDGEFANIISHPSYEIEKEYLVEATNKIPESVLIQYRNGVNIDNIAYRLKNYRLLASNKVLLTIIEGKNREIRKVFNHFSIIVKTIHRIRIGNVSIDNIKTGGFRHLLDEEIAWFFKKKLIKSEHL